MSGAYSNLAFAKRTKYVCIPLFIDTRYGMTATTRIEPPTKRAHKLNIDQDHINCNILTCYINTIQGGCVRYYLEIWVRILSIIIVLHYDSDCKIDAASIYTYSPLSTNVSYRQLLSIVNI